MVIYLLDNIKNMSDFCNSFLLYNTLDIIRTGLKILQIAGPIVAIVSLIISFILLTTNPEEEKYKKRVKNSIIATVILFLLPAIINLIMALPVVEDHTTVGQCWAKVKANKKQVK